MHYVVIIEQTNTLEPFFRGTISILAKVIKTSFDKRPLVFTRYREKGYRKLTLTQLEISSGKHA